MTGETRVMLGGMGDYPIAFCIPIVLTIILLFRRPISFSNTNLIFTMGAIFLWSMIQIVVKQQFTIKAMNNYFYMLYAIVIAYIHIRVYKRKMFYLYEDVMVKLSLLSLVIWVFTSVLPSIATNLATLFPETGYGNNLFYLVNWMAPYGIQSTYGLARNAGSSWEPGRFAIMVCLAILINLYRKGVTFRNNKNSIILLLALLTTMSTTGYVLGFVLYAYMYVRKFDLNKIILFTIIAIPLIYAGLQLEFVGKKLENKMNVTSSVEHIEDSYLWSEKHAEGNFAYSMDRFPSFVFEFENFIHDPIIGYGANTTDSYFMKTRTTYIGFTGGLMTLFSRHGIFIAIFLLFVLYRSSIRIALVLHSKKKYGILLCFLISMISYPLIWFPVYTAFWFYGFFLYDETKLISIWRRLR